MVSAKGKYDMKQLLQNLKTGETILADVPAPQVKRGCVLIKTAYSLVSLGTERMLVEFGRANLLAKARQQPERVKQVIDKIKTDGLRPTLRSVFNKLDEPLPLGYCNAGTVCGMGDGVQDLAIGDRVVSNGPHAEYVLVSRNLVAKVPESVGLEDAPFAVIGAIALQGLRLAAPTLGETLVTIGLGLVGQLSAQLAVAHGCVSIGLDIDEKKAALAATFGTHGIAIASGSDPVAAVMERTAGRGADAVIITASSRNDTLVNQAARMCRKRGRIVLVGVAPLLLNRTLFYEKELSFSVSCSYGPGRYDPDYEEKGNDYPLAYVRWTEQRNFEAVLGSMASQKIRVKPLVSTVADFDKAVQEYAGLVTSKSIATLFRYAGAADAVRTVRVAPDLAPRTAGKKSPPVVAMIGTGNFARVTLLPLLVKTNAIVKYVCSKGGVSSTHLAKKFSIPLSTTDYKEVLSDKDVDAVFICTRHNLHAQMCIEALLAGKQVFIEKPLGLNSEEIDRVAQQYRKSNKSVMVGFNRRFSPLIVKVKEILGASAPLITMEMTVNAGAIPANSWVHDPVVGGGRIIGEACHFIDLFAFLSQSPIVSVCAGSMGDTDPLRADNVTIMLKAANGSQGTVHYFSNGSRDFPKETMKIFFLGKVLTLDNFRELRGYNCGAFRKKRLFSQDKGHAGEITAYAAFLANGGPPPIPFEQIDNVSRATIAAVTSLQKGSWISPG
jgi:predicted dehydrogenase/threonine dehydrogenase-like Zn-dependent dehydrogenase